MNGVGSRHAWQKSLLSRFDRYDAGMNGVKESLHVNVQNFSASDFGWNSRSVGLQWETRLTDLSCCVEMKMNALERGEEPSSSQSLVELLKSVNAGQDSK